MRFTHQGSAFKARIHAGIVINCYRGEKFYCHSFLSLRYWQRCYNGKPRFSCFSSFLLRDTFLHYRDRWGHSLFLSLAVNTRVFLQWPAQLTVKCVPMPWIGEGGGQERYTQQPRTFLHYPDTQPTRAFHPPPLGYFSLLLKTLL